MHTFGTVLVVMLVLGALANLVLVLCLAHTWKYWRQVKWYTILLLVGNWLEVFFTFSPSLRWNVLGSFEGSEATCKFLSFMVVLGPTLTNMALAALSVHVLLTAITGCQGNRLRHVLVIGLFVLLTLPYPVSMIFDSRTVRIPDDDQVCTRGALIRRHLYEVYFLIGTTIAEVYFPAFVFLCAVIAAFIIIVSKSRGSTKGEESYSDVVIAGLLGVVMLMCDLPFATYNLIAFSNESYAHVPTIEKIMALQYFGNCRNFLSALVTVVFAYAHAFRNRGEGYIAPGGDRYYGGERQKLVN